MSTYNSIAIVMGVLGMQIVEGITYQWWQHWNGPLYLLRLPEKCSFPLPTKGFLNNTQAVQAICFWKDVFREEVDNQLKDPPVMKSHSGYSEPDPHQYGKSLQSSSNDTLAFVDKYSIRPCNKLHGSSATEDRGIYRRLLIIKLHIQSLLQSECTR